MRTKTIKLTLSVDDDGLCKSQKPATTTIALNGDLIVGGAYSSTTPQRLDITSSADDSDKTFTITGTDNNGKALVETITGPNATVVVTTGYFKTVTSVVMSAAPTGNIKVGTSDEAASPWVQVNRYDDSYGIQVDQSGSPNYTVKYTLTNFQSGATPVWTAITAFDGKTADVVSGVSHPVEGFLLVINSGDDTDYAEISIVHGGASS